MNVFNGAPGKPDDWSLEFTVNILVKGKKLYLALYTHSIFTDQERVRQSLLPNAPEFELGKWHRIRAEVDGTGFVRVFQDGMLVTQGQSKSAASRLGTAGGHWGLYASAGLERCTMLNDNITLDVYPVTTP